MASHELLQGLIEATLASSAAIVLVLLLRRMVRRGFGPQAAYALWALVPAALLATLLPAATVMVEHAPVAQRLVLPVVATAQALPAVGGMDWQSLLLGAWLFGVVACGLWQWHAQRAFRRSLGHLLPHGEVLRAQSVSAGLPATLGVLRPQVVLPADFEARFDANQRVLVLAHERHHIARRDPWANAVVALLRSLFWFNPLLLIAAVRMRHDQELACDAGVLAEYPQQRRAYGDALLHAQLALQAVPLGCHFGFGHPLKERIVMLRHTEQSSIRRFSGAALVAMLGCGVALAAWAAQPAVVVSKDPLPQQAGGVVKGEQIRLREFVTRLAKAHGKAVKGLELIPAELKVSFRFNQVPLATALALLSEETRLDVQENAGTIEIKQGAVPAASAERASVLQPGQVDAQSRQLNPPAYPADALKEGKVGTTVMVVDIDAHGAVMGAKVERSSGDARLDSAALSAVAKWTFRPEIKGGKPVASKLRVPVEFAMDEPVQAKAG